MGGMGQAMMPFMGMPPISLGQLGGNSPLAITYGNQSAPSRPASSVAESVEPDVDMMEGDEEEERDEDEQEEEQKEMRSQL